MEDQLPVYEETPSSERDYYERTKEVKDAIWNALDGHDWLVSAGLTRDTDGTWMIIVASEDVSEASLLLPGSWEAIPIRVEESSGEVQLV